LYKGEEGVVADGGRVAARPPQPLPEREGSGSVPPCRKTPFSTQENIVFYVRKRCFHSGERFGESLAVTTACCHLPPCCHHWHVFETQWFRKVGGRVAANFAKNNPHIHFGDASPKSGIE